MTPDRILYDSPEAASQKTLTGWVSRHGHFYGDNEHLARYDGCTHRLCSFCGDGLANKAYLACDRCRDAQAAKNWEKMPVAEWDGKTPFCLHDGDTYFFNAEDFYEWCEDNEQPPEEVHLVLCAPVYFSEVDEDHWADQLPEDGGLPGEIADALEAFNAVIRAYKKPSCWNPTKTRIVMKAEV